MAAICANCCENLPGLGGSLATQRRVTFNHFLAGQIGWEGMISTSDNTLPAYNLCDHILEHCIWYRINYVIINPSR